MIKRYDLKLVKSIYNPIMLNENKEGAICKYKDVQKLLRELDESSDLLVSQKLKLVKLEQQNQKLSDLVVTALGCNPHYTDQVAGVLKKLKQITRGKE